MSEREPVAIVPGSIGTIARSRGDTMPRRFRECVGVTANGNWDCRPLDPGTASIDCRAAHRAHVDVLGLECDAQALCELHGVRAIAMEADRVDPNGDIVTID